VSTQDPIYDQKILDAAAKVEAQPSPDNTFRLSSGVVLRAVRIAPLRLDAIQRQFKEPEPPEETLPDGRKIKNPDHPDYKKAVAAFKEEQGMAMLDAMIMFGTEFVSAPNGMSGPDDNAWIEEMAIVGVKVPDHPKARHLAWIKYVALDKNIEEDMALISEEVAKQLPIAEENIAKAIDSFRSETLGSADSGLLSETPKNGNNN